jgi:hypothetical protein
MGIQKKRKERKENLSDFLKRETCHLSLCPSTTSMSFLYACPCSQPEILRECPEDHREEWGRETEKPQTHLTQALSRTTAGQPAWLPPQNLRDHCHWTHFYPLRIEEVLKP